MKAMIRYLAEFKCRAVLPFHLPAVIFGMSYQTPVKCIVCPYKEISTSTLNKTAQVFNSDLSDKDHFHMRDFGMVRACRGDQRINKVMTCIPFPDCIVFFQSGFEIIWQGFVTYSMQMVTQE